MELFGITLTEYIGYFASFFVLLSFTMKNVKRLRIVNMIGCTLFIIYGFMMPTVRVGLPIIIANAAIFCVNMRFSRKFSTFKAVKTVILFIQYLNIQHHILSFGMTL